MVEKSVNLKLEGYKLATFVKIFYAMLFQQHITAYNTEVVNAVKELFDAANKNQLHENDLLLILIHGFKVQDEALYDAKGWRKFALIWRAVFRNSAALRQYKENRLPELQRVCAVSWGSAERCLLRPRPCLRERQRRLRLGCARCW